MNILDIEEFQVMEKLTFAKIDGLGRVLVNAFINPIYTMYIYIYRDTYPCYNVISVSKASEHDFWNILSIEYNSTFRKHPDLLSNHMHSLILLIYDPRTKPLLVSIKSWLFKRDPLYWLVKLFPYYNWVVFHPQQFA